MKIVHLCQYYMPGHTYQENYLPKAMERLGHQVTVIAGTRQTDFYDGPERREGDTLLDRNVKIFTTVLEPVMIVVMAFLVGFVAISMLLAVFDLTSGLKVQ